MFSVCLQFLLHSMGSLSSSHNGPRISLHLGIYGSIPQVLLLYIFYCGCSLTWECMEFAYPPPPSNAWIQVKTTAHNNPHAIVVAILDDLATCQLVFGVIHHFPSFSLHDEVVFNKLHVTSAPKTYMNFGVLTTFSLFCIASTVIEFSVAQSTFVLTIPMVAMLRSLPPLHNCRWPPLDSIEPYVRSLHNVYPFYLDF